MSEARGESVYRAWMDSGLTSSLLLLRPPDRLLDLSRLRLRRLRSRSRLRSRRRSCSFREGLRSLCFLEGLLSLSFLSLSFL